MSKLPLARSTDIVVQKMGKEILIYDTKTHKAYNLNETSTVIYNACDGVTSFDKLKSEHQFTDDLIFLALDELREENLIEKDNSLASPFAGMSRREVIKKVGLGSMIALPLISSVIAPTAANAQSGAVCNNTRSSVFCNCLYPVGATVGTSCTDTSSCPSGCTCFIDECGPSDPQTGTTCFGTCESVTA